MTYDELIAAGVWSGANLDIRKRMAGYIVDGTRFGALELKTKSGSPNDTHMEKRTSEVHTAALILSYLGYEQAKIVSLDVDGKPLERPDLDVRLPDGTYVGVEIADVSETNLRRHESNLNMVEIAVEDLLDTDALFKAAMGPYFLTVNLNGARPHPQVHVASKREAQTIINEIVEFVQGGEHTRAGDGYFVSFSAKYNTLHSLGAQYHAEPKAGDPYFSIGEGASTIDRRDRETEVLRILNDHRTSAHGYRALRTWMFLHLTDPYEYFYNTVAAIEASKPPIAPFERAYLADAVGRILALP